MKTRGFVVPLFYPRIMVRRDVLVATVVIVVVLVGGVVTLSALGKDTAALIGVITVVALPILATLGAGLYGKIEQVHQQVNGNTSKMIDAIAQSTPVVVATTDPAVANDESG